MIEKTVFSGLTTAWDFVKNPNDDIKKAYQHVAFFRGIELVTIGNYEEAIEKFNLSLKYGSYNKSYKALATYWKAESYYRLHQYNEAISSYREFILSAGAFQLKEYKIAHYNLGYCNFKQRNYNEALSWFRKFIDLGIKGNNELLADAYNRAGDITYLMSDYNTAIKYYNSAAALNLSDADYALYQEGFAYGLLGNYKSKITSLEKLIKGYPESPYIDDAYFEIAVSYQLTNNLTSAESYLIRLIDDYPVSSFKKEALVQLGLIYYNENKTEKAITTYKDVVRSYPGTDEAKSALQGLKNIYIEKNDIETYLAFVNELGGQVKITRTETDSLLFSNAENIYFKGEYDKAIVKLHEYLTNYGNSAFAKNATLYLAECYKQQGRNDEALKEYNKVISMPGNEFKEQSLLESSRINYSNDEYQAALINYKALEEVSQTIENILEAKLGKMRCEYKLKKYSEVIATVNDLLNTEDLSKTFRHEALFYQAKAYFETGKYDEAFDNFKLTAENLKKIEGAESKYRIAEIEFKKKNYNKAEDEIYDFIKKNSPHQYWVAKSYLLLAEIFIVRNDYFQANHTVQSIIEYYENKNDGILDEAREIKLRIDENKLKENEGKKSELELFIDK